MTLPVLTATFYYAAEARPYGLLLGLFGVAILSWQSANEPRHRVTSLITLALSLALAINTHYFGLLILAPLCLAEATRSLQRRRLDPPLLAAILCGAASLVATLPFQPAAAEFRQHYYTPPVTLSTVLSTYHYLFIEHDFTTRTGRLLLLAAIVIGILALAAATVSLLTRHADRIPRPDTVLLASLSFLPIFGFLLARFVTHSLSPRFLVGTVPGVAALTALALPSLFATRRRSRAVLTLLVIAIATVNLIRIRNERLHQQQLLAGITLTPAIKADILSSPAQLLYMADPDTFRIANYYAPDPELRPRFTLVYSRAHELLSNHTDTVSLLAEHHRKILPAPFTTYEELRTRPGPQIFLLPRPAGGWIASALAVDRAQVTPLAPAGPRDAAAVRFPTDLPSRPSVQP